jgi:uncharacterized membrane protein
MRLNVVQVALLGLAAMASGCVPVPPNSPPGSGVVRVDPEDAADRALIGALAGAALGTGLGATFAISPAVGAIVGVEAGAGIGATIGVLTAQPLPSYTAVAAPEGPPGFYDTWPPGYHAPPVTAGAPPPPPG